MSRRDDLAAKRAEQEAIRDVAKLFAKRGWTDGTLIRMRAAGSSREVRAALRKLADEIDDLDDE
jgi:hypothetical protein